MNWLTTGNADEIGIPVERIGPDEPPTATKGSKNQRVDPGLFKAVGAWDVRIDNSLDRGCFIVPPYEGGLHFRIGIDMRDQPEAYILLLGDSWKSIVIDDEYEIVLQFGGLRPWRAKATGIDFHGSKGLIIKFAEAKLFKEFAEQPTVRITHQDRRVANLNLKDGAAAIAALVECQKTELAKSGDPFVI